MFAAKSVDVMELALEQEDSLLICLFLRPKTAVTSVNWRLSARCVLRKPMFDSYYTRHCQVMKRSFYNLEDPTLVPNSAFNL